MPLEPSQPGLSVGDQNAGGHMAISSCRAALMASAGQEGVGSDL